MELTKELMKNNHFIKLLENWREGFARWTPMSGEVEGHDLLVGQGFVRGDGGPVETKKVLSGNQIHLFFFTSFAISKIAQQLTWLV